MRIRESERKVLEVYMNKIMDALDQVDNTVQDLQKDGYEIYVSDGYAQIVDEVCRLRKLYKIDVMRDDKRGRKRKEEVNAGQS